MKLDDIRKIAVLGAGIMGHGIAIIYARAGYPVILRDISEELLTTGIEHIKNDLEIFTSRGHMTQSDAQVVASRIKCTTDLNEAVSEVDFITEAIPENLELKRKIFADMEKYCSEETVITSNTSGLKITDIASKMSHPERTIITHYSNPPHILPLVEIVKGEYTSSEVVNLTYDFMRSVGEIPIMVKKEVEGFIINRLIFALFREAFYLLENGVAELNDIDQAIKAGFGFWFPISGPFELIDQAGTDTILSVASNLFGNLSNSSEAPEMLKRLVEEGHLGVKTGKGFYNYQREDLDKLLKLRTDEFLERAEDMHKKGKFDT